MTQHDDFNARLERTRQDVEHDIATDRTRRWFSRSGDGPWWSFGHAAAQTLGEVFTALLPFLLVGGFVVGGVAMVFDIGFMTALGLVFILLVVLGIFALGNS